MDGVMYDQFVSLGNACHVAAAMATYGFRSWSGPFDWLVTEKLEWILHYMDCEFDSFLCRENLSKIQTREKAFKEENSGFIFLHDADALYWEDYEKLVNRYKRKTERFCSEIANRTCFIRAVESQDEIAYIRLHQEYIIQVIKKYNSQNDIIFLIEQGVDVEKESFPFPCFKMKKPKKPTPIEMQHWFSGEKDLLEFLANHFSGSNIIRNLQFERKKEYRKELAKEENKQILIKKNEILRLLLETELSDIPHEIVVYGASELGRGFYKCVKSKSTVMAFIDKKLCGTKIDEVPVVTLGEIELDKKAVIVTPIKEYERIKEEIIQRYPRANVISLYEFLTNQL